MKNNKLLKQPINWEKFMATLRMMDFSEYIPNTYTNDDCLIYFTIKGDSLEINEHIGPDEPERTEVIPMPKTVKEAIDSLEKMFGDTWTEEDKEQILDDYECKIEGIRKLYLPPFLAKEFGKE